MRVAIARILLLLLLAAVGCAPQSTGPSVDASDGFDAGNDAGGLPAGSECTADAMCGSGLLCCYPCGIPGCRNRCMPPMPGTGRCPLIP